MWNVNPLRTIHIEYILLEFLVVMRHMRFNSTHTGPKVSQATYYCTYSARGAHLIKIPVNNMYRIMYIQTWAVFPTAVCENYTRTPDLYT